MKKFESIELDIKYTNIDRHKCLHFIFKGRFTEKISEQACAIWRDELLKSNEEYVLIWDCLKMNGFEMAAKNVWLTTMKSVGHKIYKVIVVSDNIIIRGTARLMLKIFSFKSEIVKSL